IDMKTYCIAMGVALIALAVTPMEGRSGRMTGSMRAFAGGSPLTPTTVDGWCDTTIGRPITQGNQGTELVDGFRTFNSMSDVIKTTRPNLTVMYNLGAAAGDGLYPSTTGNIAEGQDHCIYFTTGQGGANNRGAFCKMTPDGKLDVKYSFD